MKKKKEKSFLRKIPIILFGLIIALFVSEVVLRILPLEFTKIDFSIADDVRVFSPTRIVQYKPNSSRNWTGLGIPTVWHFNNWGFRDRVFSDKKQILGNVYRILFVGDSVVMGLGVEDYEALPRQLENQLRQTKFTSGMNFMEVFNLGIWGYGILEQQAVVSEVGTRLNPNLVIIGFLVNDPEESAYHMRNQTHVVLKSIPNIVVPLPIKDFLEKHSHLFLFLENRYYSFIERYKAEAKIDSKLHEEGWKIADESIKEIKKETERVGSKLLIMNLPYVSDMTADVPVSSDIANRLKEICKKYNVNYFEVTEALRKYPNNSSLFINNGVDVHLTPKGNQVVAELLAEYLKESSLVPNQ